MIFCKLVLQYVNTYFPELQDAHSSGKKSWMLTDIADHTQLGSPKRLDDKRRLIESFRARNDGSADERVRRLQQQLEEMEISVRESNERAIDIDRRAVELNSMLEESVRRAEEADRRAEESDGRAEVSDQRAEILQRRAEESDRRAEESDRRAEESDRRAEESDGRAEESDGRAEESDGRAEESDRRAEESDRRAEESDRRAEESDRRAEESDRRVAEVRQQQQRSLADMRQRLRECEDLLQAYDAQWVVRREEIELTGPELGRGAWATVSVAKFRGALVAVKRIHNQLVSRHNIQLFRREMNMAAKLRHPNLVQFLGATVEGDMMIIMEFMTTSLRRQLQSEEYFQPKLVKSISLDVARALSYLHQIKPDPVVHRDISSANVLLEPLLPPKTWRAKVTDYGSVNLVRQLNTENPGGPAYAAPEANNPRLQSPKMDIYSFGALMLEMLTGQLPAREDRTALLCIVHHEQLLQLIRRCLSEHIEDRPSAIAIISELS